MNDEKYVLDKKGIVCPSCLEIKYSTNKISKFINQLKSLNIHSVFHPENKSIYFEYAKEYKSEEDYLRIKWACNECLGRKKALISNTINKQRKGNNSPIFAFFDMKSICQKCNSGFIFNKDEWKYWIDELGFFYKTTKKYCENCQPIELLKKRLSKKIIEQRKLQFGKEYVNYTLEISDIYKELDMIEKAKAYLKTVINQFKDEYEIELKDKIKIAYYNMSEPKMNGRN